MLVQVTVVPTLTSSVAGEKAKFAIDTPTLDDEGAVDPNGPLVAGVVYPLPPPQAADCFLKPQNVTLI